MQYSQARQQFLEELELVPIKAAQIILELAELAPDPRYEIQRLQLLEAALGYVDSGMFPQVWAGLQNDYGNSLYNAQSGNRAENLESAIGAFRMALTVYTRNDFPLLWATTHNNLGNVWRDRIEGDRVYNQEQAIKAFQAAAEVFDNHAELELWATSQNNLGNVLRERIKDNREANLARSVAAFQDALTVRKRSTSPVEWATTQHNLGVTYALRAAYNQGEINKAIKAFESALTVRHPHDNPVAWALTQMCLGQAYAERGNEDLKSDLQLAIDAFEAALKIFTYDAFPVYWTITQVNLGTAYAKCFTQNRAANVQRAASTLHSAIKGAKKTGLLEYVRGAAFNLGQLYYEEELWEQAYAAYETALSVADLFRGTYNTDEAKWQLAQENTLFYQRIIEIALHLRRKQDALIWLEAGKSRLFLDQLSTGDFPTPAKPSPSYGHLLEKETRLLSAWRDWQYALKNANQNAHQQWLHAATKLQEVHTELRNVWSQLVKYDPDYVALRQVEQITYNQIQKLIESEKTQLP